MSKADADNQKPFSKEKEVLEESQEFTGLSTEEKERRRLRSIEVEKEARDLRATAHDPREEAAPPESAALMEKLARLEKRLAEVEEENQGLSARYVRITQQNESLTNLYVASHQLHSTLDPQEVLGIVNEILINLIGAEEFTVFLVDKTTRELTPVTGGGALSQRASGEFRWEENVLGRVVETGEAFYLDEQNPLPGGPLACVPLKIKQEVVGAVVIFKLLVQKEGFTSMDSEILNLLAGHAATAVVASHLYADAERKLKTIKGFMQLLMHRDSQPEAKIPRAERLGA